MSRYGGSLNVDGAEGPYQAYMDAVITKDSIINQLNTLLTVATLLFGVIAAVFDSISVEEYKYVETLCAESLGDGGTIAEACEYIEVSSRVVGMLQLLALFFVSWTWIGEAMYSVCTLTTLHSLSYTLSHTLLSCTLSHTLSLSLSLSLSYTLSHTHTLSLIHSLSLSSGLLPHVVARIIKAKPAGLSRCSPLVLPL
jgi:hypothetical protein